MPYEIHISKFSEDLESEIPITLDEWLGCEKNIENLKFTNYERVETFCNENNSWIPIFWLSENSGTGSMRQSGFFNRINYEKAIDIAEYLGAYIYGDEGEIIYLPNYGVLFDMTDDDNIELNIDELRQYKMKFGNDLSKIMEEVKKSNRLSIQDETNIKNNTTNELMKTFHILKSPKKSWWKFW